MHQSAIARIEAGRVQPSVATLDQLLQACGFGLELTAAVDPHELSLLSTTLPLSMEQRVNRLIAANRLARDLRDATRRAMTTSA